MTKTIIALLMFFLSLPILAEEYPYDVRIPELIDKTIEREDMHYLIRASTRCASLYQITSELLSRDHTNQDLSSINSLKDQFIFSVHKLNNNKLQSSGLSEDELKSGQQHLIDEIKQHIKIYSSWMQNNYVKQGEYFGSSEFLLREFDDCKDLNSILMQL